MPHMSNMPWLTLYVIIFLIVMFCFMALYFNSNFMNQNINTLKTPLNMTKKW